MKHKDIVEFIENSFIKSVLKNDNVTDISYNGESLYFVDNDKGRQKTSAQISQEDAKTFIRQIANMCEKQFSYQCPFLDVAIGKYRINAIHQSIGKRNNLDCIHFSIRISSETPLIYKKCSFFQKGIEELIDLILEANMSMVIGGITGTGKTEFQKYIISSMSEHTRVIVIDNVLELDSLSSLQNIDLNIWQADDKNPSASFQKLVKNALRCNPDWLIISESRGEEMVDVLNSSLTGHPIITTIHSFDLESMPNRMARMALMGNQLLSFEETLLDLSYHIRFYFYLKKDIKPNGTIDRYISSIGYLDNNKMNVLFTSDGKDSIYYRLPINALRVLNVEKKGSDSFKKLFLGGKT